MDDTETTQGAAIRMLFCLPLSMVENIIADNAVRRFIEPGEGFEINLRSDLHRAWADIVPHHDTPGFMIVRGEGKPFEKTEQTGERWVVFDAIYQAVKKWELSGDLESLVARGQEVGGSLTLMKHDGHDLAEKHVVVGREINVPFETADKADDATRPPEVISLYVTDGASVMAREGTFPILAALSDETSVTAGTLTHDTINDVVGNRYDVLRLSLDDRYEVTLEQISDFCMRASVFLLETDNSLSGIYPDDKYRRPDIHGNRLVAVHNAPGKVCFIYNKYLEAIYVRSLLSHEKRTIRLSLLECNEADHSINLDDLDFSCVIPAIIKKDPDGTLSAHLSLIASEPWAEKSVVEPVPEEVERVSVTLDTTSPLFQGCPDLSLFLTRKDSTLIFRQNINRLAYNALERYEMSGAGKWIIESAMKTEEEAIEFFKNFDLLVKAGLVPPDVIEFTGGIFHEGSCIPRTLTGDYCLKYFKAYEENLMRFPEL